MYNTLKLTLTLYCDMSPNIKVLCFFETSEPITLWRNALTQENGSINQPCVKLRDSYIEITEKISHPQNTSHMSNNYNRRNLLYIYILYNETCRQRNR